MAHLAVSLKYGYHSHSYYGVIASLLLLIPSHSDLTVMAAPVEMTTRDLSGKYIMVR